MIYDKEQPIRKVNFINAERNVVSSQSAKRLDLKDFKKEIIQENEQRLIKEDFFTNIDSYRKELDALKSINHTKE